MLRPTCVLQWWFRARRLRPGTSPPIDVGGSRRPPAEAAQRRAGGWGPDELPALLGGWWLLPQDPKRAPASRQGPSGVTIHRGVTPRSYSHQHNTCSVQSVLRRSTASCEPPSTGSPPDYGVDTPARSSPITATAHTYGPRKSPRVHPRRREVAGRSRVVFR